MDYLISEGYPDAAAKFAKEANVSSRVDVDTVHERVEIRNLIYRERIQEAIEKINEINPQVSTELPTEFALRQIHCFPFAMINYVHAPLIYLSKMLMRAKQSLQSSV